MLMKDSLTHDSITLLDASALYSFFKNRCNHVENDKICLLVIKQQI